MAATDARVGFAFLKHVSFKLLETDLTRFDLDYDLPDHLVPKLWKGRYRGQRQKWFAMRFSGTDSDINIATEHPEFCEWKWVAMEELPDIIVPFKRDMYQQLVDEFSSLRT